MQRISFVYLGVKVRSVNFCFFSYVHTNTEQESSRIRTARSSRRPGCSPPGTPSEEAPPRAGTPQSRHPPRAGTPQSRQPPWSRPPWEQAPPWTRHPPCEQNSWHMPMKILPCPKLRLRAVKTKSHTQSWTKGPTMLVCKHMDQNKARLSYWPSRGQQVSH